MVRTRWLFPLILFAVIVAADSATSLHAQQNDDPTTDRRDSRLPDNVSSLFETHCWKCHTSESRAAGLDLSDLTGVLAGADAGNVVVPSDAASSRLLEVLAKEADPHMPPMGQLSDNEIKTLTDWVDSLPSDMQTADPPTADSQLISGEVSPALAIDYYVSAGFGPRQAIPAPRCSDQVYVRRVYLDLVGRIPTPEETESFLSNPDSAKRDVLTTQLLDSPEHARHMANCFDTMLMGRDERKIGARRKHGWYDYLENAFAANRPWNDVAREVLLGREGPDSLAHRWYLYERDNDHQAIAESIAKGFFGIDIACAQCHDHPLANEIKQAHYWGLVAFFKRTKNQKIDDQIVLQESAIGGFDDYANALKGTTDSSKLVFLDAPLVDEPRPEDPAKQEDRDEFYVSVEGRRVPKFSRRREFVDQVLADHPLLARALVNRVWGLLMGRGLVHPVEQMDSTKSASHPELLDWLSRDFQNHGYDVRRLISGIVASQAYQRSSVPLMENARASADAFASGRIKPLSAEAMLASLEVALEVSIPWDGTAAMQWRDKFPEVIAENELSDLKQALLLSNFPAWHEMLRQAASGRQGPVDRQELQQMIWRVYGRSAEQDELAALLQYAQSRADDPVQARSQILWALVTSAEFRFNH